MLKIYIRSMTAEILKAADQRQRNRRGHVFQANTIMLPASD
jgi:hypothetical protein